MAEEFKQYVANMGIIVNNPPVEVYHSIGMVEHYHRPLRRVYSIITTKIPGIDPNSALQMSLKAIINLVGPNRLALTLFVFGVHSRMTESDISSPLITQCIMAMRKTMDEVQKCTTSRQVNEALHTWNELSIAAVNDLPIYSPVLVYQEGNVRQSGE